LICRVLFCRSRVCQIPRPVKYTGGINSFTNKKIFVLREILYKLFETTVQTALSIMFVLPQFRCLFQSGLFTACDLVLPPSIYSIPSFPLRSYSSCVPLLLPCPVTCIISSILTTTLLFSIFPSVVIMTKAI